MVCEQKASLCFPSELFLKNPSEFFILQPFPYVLPWEEQYCVKNGLNVLNCYNFLMVPHLASIKSKHPYYKCFA